MRFLPLGFLPGALLLAAMVLAGGPAGSAAEAPGELPPISTPQGRLRGVVRHGVIEYRGIPYGAPPVRWQPAQPAAGWRGVREARNFGPACPQRARFDLTEASDNEDCLSLNVSRPRVIPPGRRLPVLVWIHGGAFVGGGSNLYRLDALARRDLVVVSPNYRLGVLGFLPLDAFDEGATRDSNGSIGLLDQREALRWVQRNIAAFGGDPGNVTVVGESAGGGSICMHLAAPELSGGLFHKAMVMSAGCLASLPSVDQYMQQVGKRVQDALGCRQADRAAARACLMGKPLADLLAAGDSATKGQTMTFGPSIGTRLGVPRSMADALAQGKVLNVPVLMGGARDELRLYVGYDQQRCYEPDKARRDCSRFVSKDTYAALLIGNYLTSDNPIGPAEQKRILERFPLRDAGRAPESLGSVISHYNPNVGINNCLYLHTASSLRRRIGMPIHAFEFADPNALVLGVGIKARPDPAMEFGAVHSAGLNYLFPRLSNTSRIDAPELPAASRPLAASMQAMLASFAHQGAPSGPGLPAWPPFNSGRDVMRLAPDQTAIYDADAYHACGFWRELFPKQFT